MFPFWYVQAWSSPDYAPKTYRLEGTLTREEVQAEVQKRLDDLFFQSERQVNFFYVTEQFEAKMMQGSKG